MKSDFIDKIIEDFGEGILVGQSDIVDVISTGSLSLDVSTGIGGLPRGRFTEIYGAEGSGKTTIALSMSKNVIENGGKVLYIDAEIMLSHAAIEQMLGTDLPKDKFVLIQTDTAEQAFMVIEEALSSREFTLIVVDTVAALEPKAEREKPFDKATMAEISRLLPKFFRRNAAAVKESNVAVVFLNQVRDDLKSYMGGYKSPGGHGLKHHSSVIISLSKGETVKISEKIDGKPVEKSIGILTKFVIRKNKLAPPFRSYFIPIMFGKGIDLYSDAVDFCSMLGVIKKKGSYYKFEDETIGQGKIQAGNHLKEHPEILDKIKEMVYNTLNKVPEIDLEDISEDAETIEE